MPFPWDCYPHFPVTHLSWAHFQGCVVDEPCSLFDISLNLRRRVCSELPLKENEVLWTWASRFSIQCTLLCDSVFTYHHDTCLCFCVTHTICLLGLNVFLLDGMSSPRRLGIFSSKLLGAIFCEAVLNNLCPSFHIPSTCWCLFFSCICPFLTETHLCNIYLHEFPVAY